MADDYPRKRIAMPEKYLLYHLHSDYSLLDSRTPFKDYVDQVKKDGGTAIASTEHGLPRGWVSKKMYCDSVGIKFISGVETYLTRTLDEKIRDNYHTVLLAKNMDGLRELNRLMNIASREDHFYYSPRITFEEFLGLSDNIIKTSACIAGPLHKLDRDDPWFDRLLDKYDFLEVQPHVNEVQAHYNLELLELSQKSGKPIIAGTDTHSLTKYDAECRRILMTAKNIEFTDEDSFDLTYKNVSEVADLFRGQGVLSDIDIAEALNNTNKIEEMCEPLELDTSIKYPILYGSAEEDARLFRKRCWSGLDQKLKDGIIPESQKEAFEQAIEEENRVFDKLGMGGFMLSMSDLVSWAKSQGYAIGTARGSVGGSRTAYLTDIIDLNPETWKTIFSRFCNEDRVEVGDLV